MSFDPEMRTLLLCCLTASGAWAAQSSNRPKPDVKATRVDIRLSADCAISVAAPKGWSFNGIRTIYMSNTVVPVQGHFDPRGAEISINPGGVNSILSNVAKLSKGGIAWIEVKEFGRDERRYRIAAEFDGAEPFQRIRERHVSSFACGGPVVFRLRYYPESGLSSEWNTVLSTVISSANEVGATGRLGSVGR